MRETAGSAAAPRRHFYWRPSGRRCPKRYHTRSTRRRFPLAPGLLPPNGRSPYWRAAAADRFSRPPKADTWRTSGDVRVVSYTDSCTAEWGVHHAHLLVVHHVAVHHEDAGVVEEARADDGAAAFGRPRHDHGITPRPIGLRLTANLDHLERVGVDVEHMVVVLVGVADRPFLHRTQPHPLVDARGIEGLAVHGERVFLPVPCDVVLRLGGPKDQRAPACDFVVADRLERRLGQCGLELHRQRLPRGHPARAPAR